MVFESSRAIGCRLRIACRAVRDMSETPLTNSVPRPDLERKQQNSASEHDFGQTLARGRGAGARLPQENDKSWQMLNAEFRQIRSERKGFGG